MEQKTIRAALDFSWNEASLALADEQNNILFTEKIMLNGHDASALPERLELAAKHAGTPLAGITEWSVGTGPGGFTGLRVAAALISGLTYGHPEVKVRGVPSAAGLLRTAFAGNLPEKAAAIFDGRRSELLVYGMELKDGFTAVLQNPGELAGILAGRSAAALEKDRAAIAKFAPELVDGIRFAPSINAEELIFNDPRNFSTSPTDLIYLRAAVFVEARIPRKIC